MSAYYERKKYSRVPFNEGSTTCGDPSFKKYRKGCSCLACKSMNAERSRQFRGSNRAVDKSATVANNNGEQGAYEMTVTLDEWHDITQSVADQDAPQQWLRCSDPMAWAAYRAAR